MSFNSIKDVLTSQDEEFSDLIKRGENIIKLLQHVDTSYKAVSNGRKHLDKIKRIRDKWILLKKEFVVLNKTEQFLHSQGFQYKVGELSLNIIGWGKEALVVRTSNICARLEAIKNSRFYPARVKYPRDYVAPCLEQAEARIFIKGVESSLFIEIFPVFENKAYFPQGIFHNYYQLRSKLTDYQLEFADIFMPNLTQAALWGQQSMICDPDAVVRREETLGTVTGELENPNIDQLIELWFIERGVFSMNPLSFYDFTIKNICFAEEVRGIKRRLPLSQIEKRIALGFAEARLRVISLSSFWSTDFEDSIKSVASWEAVKKLL